MNPRPLGFARFGWNLGDSHHVSDSLRDQQFHIWRREISKRRPEKKAEVEQRSGWAGTLMIWSRFFVAADFDDPFCREE
jgi:hypothetical protein